MLHTNFIPLAAACPGWYINTDILKQVTEYRCRRLLIVLAQCAFKVTEEWDPRFTVQYIVNQETGGGTFSVFEGDQGRHIIEVVRHPNLLHDFRWKGERKTNRYFVS